MGYTKRPGADVPAKLLKTTENLERLGDVSPEAPVLDQNTKKEYRQKSAALTQNLKTVDMVTAKEAQAVQDHLHLNALGLQDPLQAAYFERIRAQHAESLELIAQGKPAVTELEDKQLRTLFVLAQDQLSAEEAHMLRLIEPLMTAPQREKYLGVRQADYTAQKSAPSFAETAKLSSEVLAPFILPAGIVPLGKAIGMSGTPLSIAIAVSATLGMAGAEYMQKHAAATRSHALYGVTIYEDPNAGNDLARMEKRAAETAKLEPKQRTPDRLQSDLAMFEEILAFRKEARGEKDAPAVIGLFEGHVAELKNALAAMGASGRPPEDFAVKEKTFLAAVGKLELAALSAELRPTGKIGEAEFRDGMNVIVDALSKNMLRDANPALESLVARIDAEYGISAALKKGEKVAPLPEAELRAIRLVASKDANFPETLGLGPLAISGALDITKIWSDPRVNIAGQESLDLRALLKDIEKMRFTDEGQRLQLMGKIVDYGSQAVSIGAMSLVLLVGGGFFSIPAALIPRMLGVVAGNKLKQAGLQASAAQGVDLAKGRPMSNEFEVLLDRYRNPGALLKGDANAVKQAIASELELIATVAKSVGFELSAMTPEQQASYMRFRGPVYQAINTFATELGALAASNAPASELRAGFEAARTKMYAPEVLRFASQQLIREAAYQDPDSDPFVKYATAKGAMIGLVRELLSGRSGNLEDILDDLEKNGPQNRELFRQATELRDLRQSVEAGRSKGLLNWIKKKLRIYEGMELDSVDKFAMHIIEQRFKRTSLPEMLAVRRDGEAITTKLHEELRDRWPVDQDRANEIAAELVGAVMNRTMTAVGPWSYQDVPDVKVKTEAKQLSQDPPTFEVSGTLSGGRGEKGSISVTVNAFGICDPNSIKIDLGEALLAKVAVHAIESSAAVAQIDAGAKKPELIGLPQDNGGDYLFRVRTQDGARTVAVTPDGFARLDSIKNAA